ncbi:hypothetical protein [Methanohalobium sp.]|uniref:hypothetical protein n=1 Tax=Methanohalobium sp. TaxID=2837493 RepID=UPI0025EF3741|nr:hypothetical protein [Methanohalobium sp.]
MAQTFDLIDKSALDVILNSGPTVSAANYISQTADGGEAIQAAINDLPSKGGTVHIPADGPDDGVASSGKTLSEDNVWAVTSPIDVNQMGVRIVGESRGSLGSTQEGSTGTVLLTPDSAADIAYQIKFAQSAGCGAYNMRMDGGTGNIADGNADFGIVIEDADPTSANPIHDFSMMRMSIHHQTKGNLRINATNGNLGDVRILNSVISDCSIANIAVDNAPSFFSIKLSQVISSLSGRLIDVQSGMNTIDASQIIISGNSGAINKEGIRIADSINDVRVSKFNQNEFDNAFLVVTSNGTIDKSGVIREGVVEGGSTTSHVVDNQGTITNVAFADITSRGLTGSKYVNVVNDPTNAPRCTIEGLGYNGSNDPSSGGVWNGNGVEGVRVLWDNNGTSTLAEYVNGSWYSRAL